MNVGLRRAFCSLAVLVVAAAAPIAANSPATVPASKPAAEYADPKTTYRTYIEAVRKNDVEAAKQCWVIDDRNKSGALDTIVGLWISERQVRYIAKKKFGAEADTILGGWSRVDDVLDPALDLTEKRLDVAEAKITGDTAELRIRWRKGDGASPAFEYGEPGEPSENRTRCAVHRWPRRRGRGSSASTLIPRGMRVENGGFPVPVPHLFHSRSTRCGDTCCS